MASPDTPHAPDGLPPDGVRQRIREAYAGALAARGATYRGVGWSSLVAQQVRLRVLLTLLDRAPPTVPVSVADLGCGYGALWPLLRERGAPPVAAYLGLDLCPAMIAEAARLHGADRRVRFAAVGGLEAGTTVDYGFVSGTFNYRPGADDAAWTAHVAAALAAFAAGCRRGLAFNLLHRRTARKRETMYYADPAAWLAFAGDLAAPRGGAARLVEDYLDDDFAILVSFARG